MLGGVAADGTSSWVLDLRGPSSLAGDTRVWALSTTTDGDVIAVGDLAHGCAGASCAMPFPSADGSVITVPQTGATFAARYGFDGTLSLIHSRGRVGYVAITSATGACDAASVGLRVFQAPA